MKGVSKAVSSIRCGNVLSRQAGRALVAGAGRIAYHTLASKSASVSSEVSVSAWINAFSTMKRTPFTFNVPSLESLSGASFPREIVWLAGAPGAGKGTNSSFISNMRGYKCPSIVMSSLLENPECKRIKDAGGMVDDATVFRALLKELSKPEYRHGVVVDGFPRTDKQAAWLNDLHDSLANEGSAPKFSFVMLFVNEEASIARQLARGKAISELNEVRRLGGLAPLELRATDICEAAARTRYQVFEEQYDAVAQLGARFPLAVVDASASIESVRSRLSSTLSAPRMEYNIGHSPLSQLAFA